MSVEFLCIQCHSQLQVSDPWKKSSQCPHCGEIQTVPQGVVAFPPHETLSYEISPDILSLFVLRQTRIIYKTPISRHLLVKVSIPIKRKDFKPLARCCKHLVAYREVRKRVLDYESRCELLPIVIPLSSKNVATGKRWNQRFFVSLPGLGT